MAIRARVQPIQRDIALLLKQALSPEARSAALARHAREGLADAQQHNKSVLGRIPPHETYVDRRKGAPVESVKPDGTIVYEFQLLEELMAWIGEQLALHSPILTGRYANSHRFFADGVELEPGSKLPEAREYVFLNNQPYARKVERWYSPPDGVYEAVAALAKKRFGNLAAIKFSFRAVHEGGIMAYPAVGAPAARNKKGRFTASGDRTAQKRERELRMPAIVISVR